MKDKNRKAQQRRRFVREVKKKEGREWDERGAREYKRYIKEVEERKSERRR